MHYGNLQDSLGAVTSRYVTLVYTHPVDAMDAQWGSPRAPQAPRMRARPADLQDVLALEHAWKNRHFQG